MKYDIYRLVASEESGEEPEKVFVEEFEELPAPAGTLGGRILALKNETGSDHIWVLQDD